MINREWEDVQVLSYSDEPDEYGQKRQGAHISRTVKMVVKIYSQTNEFNDPKYVDVDLIGLTKDKDITDKNELIIDDVKYIVKYVIPSSRLYQVLMKRY